MKKIFLIIIATIISLEVFSAAVVIKVHISIKNSEGNKFILSEKGLSAGDIEWSIENTVTGTKLGPGAQASAVSWTENKFMSQLSFNLAMFDVPGCGGWAGGDKMILRIKVNHPGSPYHDAIGEIEFPAPVEVLTLSNLGAKNDGLFLEENTNKIAIDISDQSFCANAGGQTVKPTVTGAGASGYTLSCSNAGVTVSGNDLKIDPSSASFTPGTPTKVTVTVTDKADNTLTASKDFNVTVKPVPAVPQITASPTEVCSGADVTLTVTNAEAGVTYTWTPAGGSGTNASVTVKPTAPTTYKATATLNDCSSAESTGTPVTIKPEVKVTGVTYECTDGGTKYTAKIAVTGTAPYTVKEGAATVATSTTSPITITGLNNSSTHNYVVSDAGGCKDATTTANYTCAEVSMTIDDVVACEYDTGLKATAKIQNVSGTYNISSTPGTITWVGNVGTIDLSSFPNNGVPTDVTATLTTADGPIVTHFNVTVNPKPAAPAVKVPSPASICAGAGTTVTLEVLNADPTMTYKWSPAGGNGAQVAVAPTTTTTYTVEATSAANCVSDASAGTQITVNPAVAANVTNYVCKGDKYDAEVTVTTGTPPFNVTLGGAAVMTAPSSPFMITDIPNNTSPSYKVSDVNGCGEATVTPSKNCPKFSISLGTPAIVACEGETPIQRTVNATLSGVTGAYTITSDPSNGITWTNTSSTEAKATVDLSKFPADGSTTSIEVTLTNAGQKTTAMLDVTVNPAPDAPVIAETIDGACKNDEITLGVVNPGQYTGATFEWSPTPNHVAADGSANFTHKENQPYKVKVTVGTCTSEWSPAVNIPVNPNISTGGLVYQCTGGGTTYTVEIPVVGTGPFHVVDERGNTVTPDAHSTANNIVISGLAAGSSHTYTITGDNVCGSVEVPVTKNCNCEATLQLSGGGAMCTGVPVNIDIQLVDARTASFTVLDPDGQVAKVVNNEAGPWKIPVNKIGNYTIKDNKVSAVLNGGGTCDATVVGTATVTEKTPMIVQAAPECTSNELYTATITVTNGTAPYGLYANATATTPVAAEWNGNVATVTNLASGSLKNIYYIKDADGCISEKIEVQKDCRCPATLLVTQSEKVCGNSGRNITLTFTASGAPAGTTFTFDLIEPKYSQKVTPTAVSATQWTYEVSYENRGTYKVKNFIAINADGSTCEGSITDPVPNVEFYLPPVVNAGGDIKVCGTDPVTLNASGEAIRYDWNDPAIQNGQPFNPPMGTTTYTVTGTDGNGCSNTDQVDVTVNPKPTVKATIDKTQICAGQPINLSSIGTSADIDRLEWTNGGREGAPIIPTGSTKYTLKGTNTATQCWDTASVTVIVNPATKIIAITPEKGSRHIAIGKDAAFGVTVDGQNVTYQWQRKVNGEWINLSDGAGVGNEPSINGANTKDILFSGVPRSWDGSEFRCVVEGECGGDQKTFTLKVSECFPIDIELTMGEGIILDEVPGDAIDGWYCKGTKISLHARLFGEEDEEEIENPQFKWYIDGLDADKPFAITDSATLSWIPEFWEDDIVVKVCGYSDGACEEVCSHYLRIKARPFDDVAVKIVVDPGESFCPGDTVKFTVAGRNVDPASTYHWYNDIFDLEEETPPYNEILYVEGKNMAMVMGQENTWVRLYLTPGPQQCVKGIVSDSLFLKKKPFVQPSLHIENNIGDTIACRGDNILFTAIWDNAGTNPTFQWYNDIWNLGSGQFAEAELKDKDMWIRCNMIPGDDVCFDGKFLTDTMVIRIMESGTVTIAADMKDKHPGDELTFISTVENMMGNRKYEWLVNGMLTTCGEPDYITDILKQGDVVVCAVSGEKICQDRVFSNEIIVDYGQASRDTIVTIYKGEKITDLNLYQNGDEGHEFVIVEYPRNGVATMDPLTGLFSYTPNYDFVGTDIVKYQVRLRSDRTKYEEGYIFITVKDGGLAELPNIITPDGNGKNDVWDLSVITSNYQEYVITVYNRAGQVVFQIKNNYNNQWDGQGASGGDGCYMRYTHLPSGIYTYVIDLNRGERKLMSWLEIRAPFNRAYTR